MEALMWSVGLFLAVFGPLLFVVPVVVLVWQAKRWGPFAKLPAHWRWGLALGLLALAVLASWLPGKWAFDAECARVEQGVIHATREESGLYRTKLFPYEASKYLNEWGFAWVEAPDPYKKGVLKRYSLQRDGKFEERTIDAISAAVEVDESFRELPYGIYVTEKMVRDRVTGAEMGRAGSANYRGGPLGILLGIYGSRHCPDPVSAEGSRNFDTFYYLERKILRPSASHPPRPEARTDRKND